MKLCQCPRTGNLHFYGICMEYYEVAAKCVNALVRATYISTWHS